MVFRNLPSDPPEQTLEKAAGFRNFPDISRNQVFFVHLVFSDLLSSGLVEVPAPSFHKSEV